MNAPAANCVYPLPDVPQVKSLLSMLFDGLDVKAGTKPDVSAKSGSYCGVYVADDGTPGALCVCDIAFAANSGAALSMLPPPVAKEAARIKELTEVMIANLREVMNICTRLLLREGSPHLKLQDLCQVSAIAAPSAAILTAPKGRADFDIAIGKYGHGLLSVMSR
jgi:hypothetical protein